MSKEMNQAYHELSIKDFCTAYIGMCRNAAIAASVLLAIVACSCGTGLWCGIVGTVAAVAWIATVACKTTADDCDRNMAELGYSEIELERVRLAI